MASKCSLGKSSKLAAVLNKLRTAASSSNQPQNYNENIKSDDINIISSENNINHDQHVKVDTKLNGEKEENDCAENKTCNSSVVNSKKEQANELTLKTKSDNKTEITNQDLSPSQLVNTEAQSGDFINQPNDIHNSNIETCSKFKKIQRISSVEQESLEINNIISSENFQEKYKNDSNLSTDNNKNDLNKKSSRRKQQKTHKVVEQMDIVLDDSLMNSPQLRKTLTDNNDHRIANSNDSVESYAAENITQDLPFDCNYDSVVVNASSIEDTLPPTQTASSNNNCEDHGFILPEGTVFVQPESVDASPTTFNIETSRPKRIFKGGNLDSAILHCTACNKQIGVDGLMDHHRHPVLKVLICRKCYCWYSSGEVEQDTEGTDEQCRWCRQGGDLICCDFCHNSFCKGCIRRNLGRKELNSILDGDETSKWKCYVCNPKPLLSLIEHCSAVMEALTKLEKRQQQQELKRSKRVHVKSATATTTNLNSSNSALNLSTTVNHHATSIKNLLLISGGNGQKINSGNNNNNNNTGNYEKLIAIKRDSSIQAKSLKLMSSNVGQQADWTKYIIDQHQRLKPNNSSKSSTNATTTTTSGTTSATRSILSPGLSLKNVSYPCQLSIVEKLLSVTSSMQLFLMSLAEELRKNNKNIEVNNDKNKTNLNNSVNNNSCSSSENCSTSLFSDQQMNIAGNSSISKISTNTNNNIDISMMSPLDPVIAKRKLIAAKLWQAQKVFDQSFFHIAEISTKDKVKNMYYCDANNVKQSSSSISNKYNYPAPNTSSCLNESYMKTNGSNNTFTKSNNISISSVVNNAGSKPLPVTIRNQIVKKTSKTSNNVSTNNNNISINNSQILISPGSTLSCKNNNIQIVCSSGGPKTIQTLVPKNAPASESNHTISDNNQVVSSSQHCIVRQTISPNFYILKTVDKNISNNTIVGKIINKPIDSNNIKSFKDTNTTSNNLITTSYKNSNALAVTNNTIISPSHVVISKDSKSGYLKSKAMTSLNRESSKSSVPVVCSNQSSPLTSLNSSTITNSFTDKSINTAVSTSVTTSSTCILPYDSNRFIKILPKSTDSNANSSHKNTSIIINNDSNNKKHNDQSRSFLKKNQLKRKLTPPPKEIMNKVEEVVNNKTSNDIENSEKSSKVDIIDNNKKSITSSNNLIIVCNENNVEEEVLIISDSEDEVGDDGIVGNVFGEGENCQKSSTLISNVDHSNKKDVSIFEGIANQSMKNCNNNNCNTDCIINQKKKNSLNDRDNKNKSSTNETKKSVDNAVIQNGNAKFISNNNGSVLTRRRKLSMNIVNNNNDDVDNCNDKRINENINDDNQGQTSVIDSTPVIGSDTNICSKTYNITKSDETIGDDGNNHISTVPQIKTPVKGDDKEAEISVDCSTDIFPSKISEPDAKKCKKENTVKPALSVVKNLRKRSKCLIDGRANNSNNIEIVDADNITTVHKNEKTIKNCINTNNESDNKVYWAGGITENVEIIGRKVTTYCVENEKCADSSDNIVKSLSTEKNRINKKYDSSPGTDVNTVNAGDEDSQISHENKTDEDAGDNKERKKSKRTNVMIRNKNGLSVKKADKLVVNDKHTLVTSISLDKDNVSRNKTNVNEIVNVNGRDGKRRSTRLLKEQSSFLGSSNLSFTPPSQSSSLDSLLAPTPSSSSSSVLVASTTDDAYLVQSKNRKRKNSSVSVGKKISKSCSLQNLNTSTDKIVSKKKTCKKLEIRDLSSKIKKKIFYNSKLNNNNSSKTNVKSNKTDIVKKTNKNKNSSIVVNVEKKNIVKSSSPSLSISGENKMKPKKYKKKIS